MNIVDSHSFLVNVFFKCKLYQKATGSNRESLSVGLKMGRKKHVSVDSKEAIWNLFQFFEDEAQRGRPRHKSIYKKIEKSPEDQRVHDKTCFAGREGKRRGFQTLWSYSEETEIWWLHFGCDPTKSPSFL